MSRGLLNVEECLCGFVSAFGEEEKNMPQGAIAICAATCCVISCSGNNS